MATSDEAGRGTSLGRSSVRSFELTRPPSPRRPSRSTLRESAVHMATAKSSDVYFPRQPTYQTDEARSNLLMLEMTPPPTLGEPTTDRTSPLDYLDPQAYASALSSTRLALKEIRDAEEHLANVTRDRDILYVRRLLYLSWSPIQRAQCQTPSHRG